MKSAFIFHGTAGFPEENWFPWLKEKLEKINFKVFVPQFPTPKNQSLENWFKVFENIEKFYAKDSILVGHSLGWSFALRVLEKYAIKIDGAFFVATPIGIPPITNWAGDKPFTGQPFDWKKIKTRAKRFAVFHSDNDPFVGIENGKELAKKLGTKLELIPNAGHFNSKSGYTQFEELFKKIVE